VPESAEVLQGEHLKVHDRVVGGGFLITFSRTSEIGTPEAFKGVLKKDLRGGKNATRHRQLQMPPPTSPLSPVSLKGDRRGVNENNEWRRWTH